MLAAVSGAGPWRGGQGLPGRRRRGARCRAAELRAAGSGGGERWAPCCPEGRGGAQGEVVGFLLLMGSSAQIC
jgi:hypothetical protein